MRPPVQNNFSPRFPLLPGLLSHLRWNKKSVKYWHVLVKFIRFGQGLAPKPAPPSTSYITSTVTKVSTITSDVTEEIIITFLNRPITTNYVRTTTMVRSINVIFVVASIFLSSGRHRHPRVSVTSHIRVNVMRTSRKSTKPWPWKIKLSCKIYTEILIYKAICF